jgi:hypothetical protein
MRSRYQLHLQELFVRFFIFSITPSTADAGVKACARDFCSECNTEELMPFFDCGYGISNAVDECAIPDSSIRTPPPSNSAIDESVYDLVNCPSSSTNCIMIAGYEFKKCIYYEMGVDVMCECSEDEPVRNCTGTITIEECIVETEDSEVTIEKEAEIVDLPTADGRRTPCTFVPNRHSNYRGCVLHRRLRNVVTMTWTPTQIFWEL